MRKFTESDADTLKDIERTYGREVAQALVKYCSMKKTTVDDVVTDMKTDGNGMTEWDKFDVWAKKTLKLDIMGNFDDTIDWTGAEDDRKREQEFKEGSGSNPCDEYFISNWIGEQLSECEWAQDVDFGESPIIVTTDAGQFTVTVEPM